MKKLTLIFLIFYSAAAFCQHPYKQDLQSEAQIIFPDTPKVDFAGSATYYVCQKDQRIYFAQVIDLNKINPDSLNLRNRSGLYDQFIESVIKPENGKLFYKGDIESNGLKGISFNYTCVLKGNTYYAYQRAFHADKAIISYSVLSTDSLQSDDYVIKTFFDTFKLTPAKAAELNKKSGILAAVLMGAAAVFWVAIVIFLIKKLRKKKVYTWPDQRQ
ncbi:hypothetical protein [Mucilaginibacter ginsenosidivorans]|uniref:Uncharacterized protein n=1 Tax=Mucilaginibacter ginsenosidivorans TaxID=398053 RepID=A0A5B8V066_9SPHI|nr:hypothetical protein [Mucilaginibacter ginsenosidivorans]QEC63926.1 hypothetical protein FRZ54_15530 [Mucilaginibacter ginsenosidivorans]